MEAERSRVVFDAFPVRETRTGGSDLSLRISCTIVVVSTMKANDEAFFLTGVVTDRTRLTSLLVKLR